MLKRRPLLANSSLSSVAQAILGAMMTAYIGYRIAQPGFSYREVIIGAILLVGLATLFLAEIAVHLGLTVLVLMFVLGYRAIHVTEGFDLHPMVLFVLVVFGLTLVRVYVLDKRSIKWPTPRVMLIFSPFWLWGWGMGMLQAQSWGWMMGEFVNFVAVFPIFAVVSYCLEKPAYWKILVGTFFAVGTVIAALGL